MPTLGSLDQDATQSNRTHMHTTAKYLCLQPSKQLNKPPLSSVIGPSTETLILVLLSIYLQLTYAKPLSMLMVWLKRTGQYRAVICVSGFPHHKHVTLIYCWSGIGVNPRV